LKYFRELCTKTGIYFITNFSGFGNIPSPQSKKHSHQNNQQLAYYEKNEEKS